MDRKTVFNVVVGGVSIGMTFKHVEAQKWLLGSKSNMTKEIRHTPYHVDEETLKRMNA